MNNTLIYKADPEWIWLISGIKMPRRKLPFYDIRYAGYPDRFMHHVKNRPGPQGQVPSYKD